MAKTTTKISGNGSCGNVCPALMSIVELLCPLIELFHSSNDNQNGVTIPRCQHYNRRSIKNRTWRPLAQHFLGQMTLNDRLFDFCTRPRLARPVLISSIFQVFCWRSWLDLKSDVIFLHTWIETKKNKSLTFSLLSADRVDIGWPSIYLWRRQTLLLAFFADKNTQNITWRHPASRRVLAWLVAISFKNFTIVSVFFFNIFAQFSFFFCSVMIWNYEIGCCRSMVVVFSWEDAPKRMKSLLENASRPWWVWRQQ